MMLKIFTGREKNILFNEKRSAKKNFYYCGLSVAEINVGGG